MLRLFNLYKEIIRLITFQRVILIVIHHLLHILSIKTILAHIIKVYISIKVLSLL